MRRIIVAILGMVLTTALLAMAPQPAAQAVGGCHGRFVLKGSVWGVTVEHNDMRYRYGWVEQYYMCPNGSKMAKMKGIKSAVCVTKMNETTNVYMAGFKFQNRIATHHGGFDKTYRSFKLDWDNGAGEVGKVRCVTNNHKNTPWLMRDQIPYWKAWGWVRYHYFADSPFFWGSRAEIREFDLFGDPILDPFNPRSSEDLFADWVHNQKVLEDSPWYHGK